MVESDLRASFQVLFGRLGHETAGTRSPVFWASVFAGISSKGEVSTRIMLSLYGCGRRKGVYLVRRGLLQAY